MVTEGENAGPLDSPDEKAKPTVRAFIESEQPTLQPQTSEQLRANITSDDCQTIQPGSLDRLKMTDDSMATVPPKPTTDFGNSHHGKQPLPEQEPGFPLVPGYHILKELGKGGMGVVYLARQIKLHRQVALKMIRGGFVERQEQRQRFLVEAEAVAKLQHPNIVQIFEVGDVPQTDGSVIPYMALEFVGGPSLEGHLNGKPMTSQSAAELVSQLAFAMHFAHEQHLIHRDLKPANILLAPAEDRSSKIQNQSESRQKRYISSSALTFIPKITDFGLAKQIDADSSQTKAGEIMGTPSYMAPEQAAASKDIGPAADTYALGAILYELLTGRPPFRAATSLDTILQVIEEEPVPPARLQPNTPRDLETICLKCLSKPVAKRYASAAELGEDLQRYLNQEPIKARPVGLVERVWKWSKRRPTAAALVVVSLLALIALIAGGIFFNQMVLDERDIAIDARKDAQIQRDDARLAKVKADSSAAETQKTLDFFAVSTGLRLMDEGNLYRGLLWCARPLRETGPYRQPEAVFRDRLSQYLHFGNRLTMLQQWVTDAGMNYAIFSPDGRWVATAHNDDTIRVWDTVTGQPVSPILKNAGGQRLLFTKDGKKLIGVAGKMAQIWDTTTWKNFGSFMRHTGNILQVRFSPDGSQIATASQDRTVRIWSALDGSPVGKPIQLEAEVNDIVYREDGKVLATASGTQQSGKGRLRLWRTETGEAFGAVMEYPDVATQVTFSPNSEILAGASLDGTIKFWDAATGAAMGPTLKTKDVPHRLAFDPKGERMASCSQDWFVSVWDVASGRLVQTMPHTDYLYGVEYSKDGKMLLSYGEDKTARVWDTATGQAFSPSLPHRGAVTHATFNAAGTQVVTCSDDGTARLWDVASRQARPLEWKHPTGVWSVTASPDGTLAVTGDDDYVHFWKLPGGEGSGEALKIPGKVRSVVFHPQGLQLAICGEQDEAHVLNVAKRSPAFPPLKHSKRIANIGYSPDGKWLVTAGLDGTAKVWSAEDGKLVQTLTHKGPVISASFNSQGTQILTTCANGTVWLWDHNTGKPVYEPWKHGQAPVIAGVFSPDGQYAATCSYDYTARVWNVRTGKPMLPALQHQYEVMTVAFHPDSRRLITSSYDKTARIWDVETCQSVGPPLQHLAWAMQALFSQDGKYAVTISRDRTARLWDADSAQAMCPPLKHEARIITEWFVADQRLLITGGFENTSRLWTFPADARPATDIVDLVEMYDGHRLNKLGGLEQLTNAELKDRWERLRKKYPEEFIPRAAKKNP